MKGQRQKGKHYIQIIISEAGTAYTCFVFTLLFSFFIVVALGLHCCVQATLCRGAWASHCSGWFLLLQSTGSRSAGFSSCSMWAQQLWCIS